MLEPRSHNMVDELARIPLFAELQPEALALLAAAGTSRTYAADAVLWLTGQEPDGLYVVLSGEVRIVRARQGRQHVVHTAGPGATIGEVPLLAGGGYPATAVATRATRCFVLEAGEFRAALAGHPELAWRLLRHLSQRISFLVERLDERHGLDVRGRVVRELLERSAAAAGPWFRLAGTQADLAEKVGSAREVVVRVLADLRARGHLESDGRGRYRIPDRAALSALTP
ncbi:MAG: Crp/Fnr family transcriptional regulator [Gemmatimonadota bacterium]